MKKGLHHYQRVLRIMKTSQPDTLTPLLLSTGAIVVGLLMRRSDVPLSGSIGIIAICLGTFYFLLSALATYCKLMDAKKHLQAADGEKDTVNFSTRERRERV